jgi:hypothetical protein
MTMLREANVPKPMPTNRPSGSVCRWAAIQ